MISSVFVARPRLAAVIAIVTTIAGILSLFVIPIAQYPDIVPPQVSVTTTYPGASASVVEATVAQPIESQVVGVDKAIYMKSVSGNEHLLAAGKTAVKNRVGTLSTADLDAADPPQRAGAVPHNDTQRRRVHQALPTARSTEGVSSHPPLRAAGQRRLQGQHRAPQAFRYEVRPNKEPA